MIIVIPESQGIESYLEAACRQKDTGWLKYSLPPRRKGRQIWIANKQSEGQANQLEGTHGFPCSSLIAPNLGNLRLCLSSLDFKLINYNSPT